MYHGARFDLASGAPRGLPAVKPVKRFDVEVRGDEVFVRKN
jgi:nitrite reductase/ring-hydroxylating ferredoxin subunit